VVAANDYMVESAQFSDAQLDHLLVDDMQAVGGHSFLEVNHDKDGKLVQIAR
jgi:hypothetical protein